MNFLNLFYPFFKNRLPGQLVIQFTNVCNALCPQCEMRKSNNLRRNTLSENKIKSIIDRASKNKIAAVSFTGGEPLLFPETLKNLLLYAKEKINSFNLPFKPPHFFMLTRIWRIYGYPEISYLWVFNQFCCWCNFFIIIWMLSFKEKTVCTCSGEVNF